MEVSLLIQQSYIDAQLLAEEGESVTSTQLKNGLRLLNRIIRRINIDGFEISLISDETFNLTSGISTLELIGWIKIEKVQYYLGDVLIDLQLQDLNKYYNNAIIRNTSGTPFVAYQKRIPSGIMLNIFLKPDQDYEIIIRGYKELSEFVLSDEININTIEGFMEDYIGYLLSIDLQIYHQLSVISPWLIIKSAEYKAQYDRLRYQRLDQRLDKMGEEESGGRSIIGKGLSGGWTF